jgi:outer membrane protein assembly factor BamD (BamD/ComL family)
MRIWLIFTILAAGLLSCSPKEKESDLYTRAEQLLKNQKFEEAVYVYNQVLEKYPEGEKAPKSAFMAAFIYANYLDDLENGRKYYELFLKRYGDQDENLTKSAQWELDHLGKPIPDLDIIKKSVADSTK